MEKYERLRTSSKELQVYRKLDKILSGIAIGEYKVDGAALTGPERLNNLLHAWFFQLGQIFDASCGSLKYFDRVGSLLSSLNFRGQFDWDDKITSEISPNLLTSQSQYLTDNDRVVFSFHLPTHGLVLCGYKRENKAFVESELGLLGEYINLLNERLELYRRWDIERWKSKIIGRKTMLKELRPKSLFYNLLYSAQRIVPCNHVSTILTLEYETQTLIVSAELIRFSESQSWRIDNKIALGPAEWDYLNNINSFELINSSVVDASDSIERRIMSLLYPAPQFLSPKSVLLIPLKYRNDAGQLLIAMLLLADSRETYFRTDDGSYISAVVNAASPTIYNSLHFGKRLETFTKELESQLMSSSAWEENVHRIAELLKKHFDADLCQMCVFNHTGKDSKHWKQPLREAQLFFLSDGTANEFRLSIQSVFLRTLCRGKKTFVSKDLGGIEQFEFPNIINDYAVKSAIASPIVFNNELLGFISCYFESARTFSQFERFQMDSASQLIGAVVAYRLRTKQQLDDLSKVLSIMEELSAEDDDQRVREQLVNETKEFLRADYCFISTPNETGKGLVTSAKTWGLEFDIPVIKVTGKPGDGITSYVAKHRKPYISKDVSKDKYYKDINLFSPDRIKIRSEMAAPLLANGKLIGIIDVMSSRKNAFSVREKTLFEMLLNQSSLAIENARIAREKRNHINIVDALQARLINLTAPDAIYSMILETARTYISQFHHGSLILGNLYVKRHKSSFLEVKAFIGEKSDAFLPVQHLGEGIVGHVARTGKGVIIRDTSRPPSKLRYQPFIKGIKRGSEISVPIKVGTEVSSVINLESSTVRLFGTKDLEILSALASEISVGVKFAQLHEELHRKQEMKLYRQELKFLHVLSHEVMRSAKNTSAEIPKLKRRITKDSISLNILSRIELEVEKTLGAQANLMPFAGKRKFTPIDIIAVLNLKITWYRKSAKKIQFQNLVTSKKLQIDGNEDFAAYIFDNLIRNAIDAMGQRGTFTIEEVESDTLAYITLLFSDNGHGIRNEIRDNIWEPYFSDDGHGKQKGLGLGLWLIRDLTQRMNGEIMLVDSVPFKRTTFMLTFRRIDIA